MSSDLHEAKQKLLDKLGPNYGAYIQLLAKWFRGLISKEEFDKSAKQLIEHNFVLEHNKFWLAFFHHCANSESNSLQSHSFQLNNAINRRYNQNSAEQQYGINQFDQIPDPASTPPIFNFNASQKVRCLPNKVITHMKIFVIAWEMGLDSANDHVSIYINLALQHFLKNIITELICTKTAYRLRENRFRYAIGVKPMNPYLSNSLRIYSTNLEYDPYQIESNKMNSSLVDTYAYNDSLFPSRLYEAQALYEYACSTTSVANSSTKKSKRVKLSELFLEPEKEIKSLELELTNGHTNNNTLATNKCVGMNRAQPDVSISYLEDDQFKEENDKKTLELEQDDRKISLFHLLLTFLADRTIIPSQSLYSLNLERIFTRLSQ